MLPPLRSIDRRTSVPDTPANTTAGVLYWFTRLGHVHRQQAVPLYCLDLDIRRHTDFREDRVPQPVDVELGPNDLPSPVLNAVDQSTAARRVGHACDLVAERNRSGGILRQPRIDLSPPTAPSGLLLEVDRLSLLRRANATVDGRREQPGDGLLQFTSTVDTGDVHGDTSPIWGLLD
ncbi:hypothetical protein BKA16_000702 [Gordonia humi]|uniref:Uncharacterized protein n=1 Tax=Gordonia humi TaxID=686429 RepID=A0A840F1D1_9ACTN|nr:hypothetical protein [Gordonia humi]